MSDALVITVNYKGADSTERFLASVSALQGHSEIRVLVVENGSKDGSAERLRKIVETLDNVDLLESQVNRGYFGAANWALQQYLSAGHKPGWVVVCNNDIVFDGNQFLETLLERDAELGQVIAPAIIARQTACDSNPFLRERPSRWQLLRYQFWQSNFYLMWVKQFLSPYARTLRHRISSRQVVPNENGRIPIYAPHGACLIFSRGYFEAGGYIDDGFFLYAEEFSVAEICRKLKIPVIHDPDLRVLHDAHRVTGRMCNRTSFQQGREGFEYALRTYFFPRPDETQQLRG